MLRWVEQCLAPVLQPGSIVIWDNLSVHNDARLLAAIERRGAELVFLPPYSPGLNPIEQAWFKAKAKAILRKLMRPHGTRLLSALAQALQAITASDAAGSSTLDMQFTDLFQ